MEQAQFREYSGEWFKISLERSARQIWNYEHNYPELYDTKSSLTNLNSDLLKERFELHNIDFVIRGARDTDIDFMNCSREEVLSIARSMI